MSATAATSMVVEKFFTLRGLRKTKLTLITQIGLMMDVVQLCGADVSGREPMTKKLATLVSDKRAATTVEYGMICVTLVLGVIGAVRGVADETNGLWATVSTKTSEAMSPD